jgi:tryprostatin B 6-hydroxylase
MLTSDLSDTVAPTLVFAIYQLALNPDKAEKLYQEVKDVSIKDLATLKKLPYLNAVIMETLRLHPAVPTGGNRDTPPEGMMIDGTFIPGNTTIVAPRYVLSRRKLNPPMELFQKDMVVMLTFDASFSGELLRSTE